MDTEELIVKTAKNAIEFINSYCKNRSDDCKDCDEEIKRWCKVNLRNTPYYWQEVSNNDSQM